MHEVLNPEASVILFLITMIIDLSGRLEKSEEMFDLELQKPVSGFCSKYKQTLIDSVLKIWKKSKFASYYSRLINCYIHCATDDFLVDQKTIFRVVFACKIIVNPSKQEVMNDLLFTNYCSWSQGMWPLSLNIRMPRMHHV